MSTLIDVHKAGELIYTLSEVGVLLAWRVNDDGSLFEVDVNRSLEQEANAE